MLMKGEICIADRAFNLIGLIKHTKMVIFNAIEIYGWILSKLPTLQNVFINLKINWCDEFTALIFNHYIAEMCSKASE